MGWKTKTALCIAAILVVNYGHGYYRWHTGPTCDEITYEEAEEIVRNDLVKYRIPRWQDFQPDRLGTDKPDISFNKRKSHISGETYNIYLTVSGPLEAHHKIAMVICRLGGVEYAPGARIY